MTWNISADDGLEVIDVKMNTRPIHQRINMPYYNLFINGGFSGRCELKPNSTDPFCSSKLVGLSVNNNAPTTVIEAVYDVSNVPSGTNSCLVITQRYEFWGVGTTPQCNPMITDLCAPYFPKVSYTFIPDGSTFASIATAQRLEFRVGEENTTPDPNKQAPLVARDCDGVEGSGTPIPCNARPPFISVYANNDNPLRQEFRGIAINNGLKGDWDNFHQTYNRNIDVAAMCLECAHMHWRYSNVYGGQWNLGKVLIPVGSTQTADFGVVRARSGEEDPSDWHGLVNAENLRNQAPVFYWGGVSISPSDTFFYHGGYVYPNGLP